MKIYKGVTFARINDPQTRDQIATIDEFLLDLQTGLGRITKGISPTSSGNPLVPPPPVVDITTVTKFRFMANGPFIVDTSVDGAYIAPTAFTLTKTILTRRSAGSGGTTTVVLKQNGSTIDTRSVTAAAGTNATDTSGVLAIAIALGDRLTVDTTAVETGTPLDYAYEVAGA